METDSNGITHPFYDIEVEAAPGPADSHLIKILAIDGRRFTYLLKGALNAASVAYVKQIIDGGSMSDLVIESDGKRFRVEEASTPLKKHG